VVYRQEDFILALQTP